MGQHLPDTPPRSWVSAADRATRWLTSAGRPTTLAPYRDAVRGADTDIEERGMRFWITRPRAAHEWPARGLRMTLLVGLGLGGLAGCAMLTDGTTPELGQSLDGVRQEVAQLRAETAQLRAML